MNHHQSASTQIGPALEQAQPCSLFNRWRRNGVRTLFTTTTTTTTIDAQVVVNIVKPCL